MMKIQTFVVGPIETNCYLVYDDASFEAILIDPGVFDERIADFIQNNKIKVQYIVDTHGHYDHISGNKEFGYPILIHEKDKDCLNDSIRSLAMITGGRISKTEPHRILRDTDLIHIKGLSFKVIHTPGHTPGGISLESGDTLFTGDTLFYEGVGRTDIPFASSSQLSDSLARIMRYDDEIKIYPGHGPASTIGHERQHNPFL